MYEQVIEYCKPSVSHPYYLFSLQDLFKVVSGLEYLNKEAVLMSVTLSKTTQKTTMDISSKPEASKTLDVSHRPSISVTGPSSTPRLGLRRQSYLSKKNANQSKKASSAQQEHLGLTIIARLWCHENCRVYRDKLLASSSG